MCSPERPGTGNERNPFASLGHIIRTIQQLCVRAKRLIYCATCRAKCSLQEYQKEFPEGNLPEELSSSYRVPALQGIIAHTQRIASSLTTDNSRIFSNGNGSRRRPTGVTFSPDKLRTPPSDCYVREAYVRNQKRIFGILWYRKNLIKKKSKPRPQHLFTAFLP